MSYDFYNLSEEFLVKLCDKIDQNDDNCIFEAEYSDGILNITAFSTNQQYVVNRHSANQKIWYSSPISGADYFSYNEKEGKWLSDKNIELEGKLTKELVSFTGFKIKN